MTYTRHITFLFLVAALLAGCRKDDRTPAVTDGRILFSADILDVNVGTRASVVTSSSLDASGIYVSATSGSAGSETSLWTSTAFTKTGSYFDGGRYWDESNPGYHFYSANAPLTFSAAGTTVSASNTTDVVCEYLASPAFKGLNTLSFDHIFARIGNVTVSAADGYTITNVHMSITPYTGGTYNLRTGSGQSDGTGWSALVSGSATELANTTPSTKSNDLYLVPGTYDISVTWTATKGAYTIDAEKTFSDVAVEGGKVNAVTVSLKGDASSVELGVTVTPWTGNTVAMGEVMAIEEGTFGGLYIAQGNMYYDGSQFRIADDYTYNSYDTAYGLTANSSYFNWDQCHDVSVDGWRVPTDAEWKTIITDSPVVRPGSTVNGVVNCHFVLVQLSTTEGLLIFPDGKDIYGANLDYIDSIDYVYMDLEDLNNYVSQGCAFLTACGNRWHEYGFEDLGMDTFYWVSDSYNSDNGKSLMFGTGGSVYPLDPSSCFSDKLDYLSVRLVKKNSMSFGGIEIAPGNLYWNGSSWSIDDVWNEHCTYNTAYRVNSGTSSTHFNYIEMGTLFEKDGFNSGDGDIENLLDPFDGWRLPTQTEMNAIFTTSSDIREGSTVNGSANKHYSLVQLTGITYAGNSTPLGLLVFPDGKSINGIPLAGFDNTTKTTGVTVSELNEYLDQGCVFLPAVGSYNSMNSSWWNGGSTGSYWSSSIYSASNAYYLNFYGSRVNSGNNSDVSRIYFSARLVRTIE